MQAADLDIKQFTSGFFKSIGAQLSWHDPILKVTKVPEQFETFIGKKGPYTFVFDDKHAGAGELLTKGSYFITAMSRFMSSRSKKTLLVYEPELEPKDEILSRFTFPNAELTDVTKKIKYDTLIRFTFSTTFQYRNGKKQETHTIYCKDGKILPLDFSKLSFNQTEKRLTRVPSLDQPYNLAKDELKRILAKRTQDISSNLKPLLDNELARIKQHTINALEEIDEEIGTIEKQIAKLQDRLARAKEKDRDKLAQKLHALQSEGQKKQESRAERIETIEKERDFMVEEETHKHSLNVTNKLINTSIIFIPHYTFKATLSNEYGKALAQIEYDALQKYMPPVNFGGTDETTYSPYIDAAGTLTKKDRLTQCFEDNKPYDKELMLRCAHSGKLVYKNNADVCASTGKTYGKSYLKQNGLTGKKTYVNIMKKCPASNKWTTKDNFTKCPSCGTEVIKQLGLKRFMAEGRTLKVGCGVCVKG